MTADVGTYPGEIARRHPGKVATVVAETGRSQTYGELDERSTRLARAFRQAGATVGDRIAVSLPNDIEFMEVCWAALRSGLYCTPLNPALMTAERDDIVDDAAAKVLVTADGLAVRGSDGWTTPEPYEQVISDAPAEPLTDETEGAMLLYSSGTTGRPKRIDRPLSGLPPGSTNPMALFVPRLGLGSATVFLSPGPLYHAAPVGFSLVTHRLGGTLVISRRFDAAATLTAIERHRVTHAQFVPTMLSRLLRLPVEFREQFDLTSLSRVVHAAAPCPVEVKRQVIDWWGPILDEYYSGSEGVGITYITSNEWLDHPGSVGRPILGTVHVLDDDGNELPAHEVGTIYFSGGATEGPATLDDMGYVDSDGYVYLTDRRTNMIVSGGVNIYPREIEEVLLQHPAVADVAVIGVPDGDFGEQVKALVQPAAESPADDSLADELMGWCRQRLAAYKCPRSVDFVELPREPTGKLPKGPLRERYWSGHQTRIV